MNRTVALLAGVAAVVALGTAAARAQRPQPMVGHLARPETREATDERIARLRVPPGFRVSVFARNLEHPRMLAVAADGTVFVSRPDRHDVLALRDRDGDGRADESAPVLTGLGRAHGLAIHRGRLFVAGVRKVVAAEMRAGGGFGDWVTVVDHLPDGGQHGRRTIGFDPLGRLYVSVGSSCNACDETNPEHATVLQARPEGGQRRVFARGLRNTIGFAWHPDTGDLWGMDHGSDWRGDDQPPEELNRILDGRDYGWPFCFGDRQPDPYLSAEPARLTTAGHCRRSEPPVLTYQAHSAPIALVFYTGGQFPAEYRNDAFVAMRGSWNREPPTGYKVVRLRFQGGAPQGFEDFLTGFLIEEGRAHFGRPAGLAVARDGALLLSDDTNGVIYRITHGGPPPG
jgi:glucose/arabinose dehydrogenase